MDAIKYYTNAMFKINRLHLDNIGWFETIIKCENLHIIINTIIGSLNATIK